jgi:hypothetical protein
MLSRESSIVGFVPHLKLSCMQCIALQCSAVQWTWSERE